MRRLRLWAGQEGRARRGQSLVEFALVLPIFLLLFMVIVDFGTAVFSYNSVTNAAREGARLAVVNQDDPSVVLRAQHQVAIAEIVAPSVSIDYYQAQPDGSPDLATPCPSHAVGCLAVVTFQATYRPLTPIIGRVMFSNGVTFTATSVQPIEFSCPNAKQTTADQCPKQP